MNIAIAGYGLEGKSNFAYFSRRGHTLTIIDERAVLNDAPMGVPTRLGTEAFKNLGDFDMVIRTASMSPAKLAGAKKIWSATNEFFAGCPAPIIGVTGTKGKGTTASLIASILRAAGRKVHLIGNIGVPPLDVLDKVKPDDIVVYELSSFQLWDIQKSPHIAVVLMIEPDHLEVHADFEDYVGAKANIVRFQSDQDTVVYNQHNHYSRSIAKSSNANKIPYPDKAFAHVKDQNFYYGEQKLCPASTLQLPGQHNIENACAAIDVTWILTQDIKAIQTGLETFKGLPHRLQLIRTIGKVRFYDDSYSSAQRATQVAIAAFADPVVLIAGGYDRGLDYTDLAAAIIAQPNIKKVMLIGQTALKIAAKLPSEIVEIQHDFTEAIHQAYDVAKPEGIVLFSPGCASFDMFKNFTERGEAFQQIVRAL